MPDSRPAALSSAVRAAWLVLAALDACLLVYLTLSYRWLAWDIPDAPTPAAIIVYAILYGAILLFTAFTAGVVIAIGAGIAGQFRPGLTRSRWLAGLAVTTLIIALCLTVFEWFRHVQPIVAIRDAARVDRLEVFEQLVEPAGNGWRPRGLVSSERMSIGLYLGVLVALAYLVEKYLLAWLRVRWPLPLVPVVMLASLAWLVTTGERVQREFVTSREWRPVAEGHTFPQALDACEELGPGWTLPRPSELQMYISTRPEAIRTWKGVAWTNQAAERGGTRGVVVELAPRKSGLWRQPDAVNRSVSACETDTREREREPVDAFTQQQARLCEATLDSPLVHPTSLVIVVLRRGMTAEFGQAGTVCVKRGSQQGNPGLGGRRYAQQHEFSTGAEYLASVKVYCASRTGLTELICFTLAGETLPFEENSTERMYRLACEHQGRVEGCDGYAKLMDLRGETERARQYRARASLLGSRTK